MDYFKNAERQLGPGGLKCRCCNTYHPETTKNGNKLRRRETRRRRRHQDRLEFQAILAPFTLA